MTDRLILITLLVKLGVMASVASVLARAATFRRLFFAEGADPDAEGRADRKAVYRTRGGETA